MGETIDLTRFGISQLKSTGLNPYTKPLGANPGAFVYLVTVLSGHRSQNKKTAVHLSYKRVFSRGGLAMAQSPFPGAPTLLTNNTRLGIRKDWSLAHSTRDSRKQLAPAETKCILR